MREKNITKQGGRRCDAHVGNKCFRKACYQKPTPDSGQNLNVKTGDHGWG